VTGLTWCENGIKDCATSSNGGKSLHELYTVLVGIVATVSVWSLVLVEHEWANYRTKEAGPIMKKILTRVAESEVFAWSRILNNTGSRIFCPTPYVQLDHFLHNAPKLGIPVEMVQFLIKTFVETELSCCAPRFPLILTVRFHSFCVKESGSEILESRSRIFYLRLRNPDLDSIVSLNCKSSKDFDIPTLIIFHYFVRVHTKTLHSNR